MWVLWSSSPWQRRFQQPRFPFVAPALGASTAAGLWGWGGGPSSSLSRRLPDHPGGFLGSGPAWSPGHSIWPQGGRAGCQKCGRCSCSVRHPHRGAPEAQGLGCLEAPRAGGGGASGKAWPMRQLWSPHTVLIQAREQASWSRGSGVGERQGGTWWVGGTWQDCGPNHLTALHHLPQPLPCPC